MFMEGNVINYYLAARCGKAENGGVHSVSVANLASRRVLHLHGICGLNAKKMHTCVRGV